MSLFVLYIIKKAFLNVIQMINYIIYDINKHVHI